jgi:creatinine amidohydrolase/Fe(II)-dependent formamide hydrolase-like protein
LVGEFASLQPVQAGNPFEPATRAWIMKDRSVHGHLGCPAAATPEKGEKLFNLYTAGVVDLLKRAVAWNGKDWH